MIELIEMECFEIIWNWWKIVARNEEFVCGEWFPERG